MKECNKDSMFPSCSITCVSDGELNREIIPTACGSIDTVVSATADWLDLPVAPRSRCLWLIDVKIRKERSEHGPSIAY